MLKIIKQLFEKEYMIRDMYDGDDDHVYAYDYSKKDVMYEAEEYYHHHFNTDEDYNENFKIRTFKQAVDFWYANGFYVYETKLIKLRGLDYENK